MTDPAESSSLGVHVEVRDRCLRIELRRPERRNAYDAAMAKVMIAALEAHTEVDAVVLQGSRGSFCAGGALGALGAPSPTSLRDLFTTSLRLVDAIRSHPRPVIAAVDGAAAGGGNELVVACDFAIATARSTFGQTGPRVGSSPVLGATNVMTLQIGEKRAKELAMMCRQYSADQALRMGLVNEVCDDDGLEDAVRRWTEEIYALSPRYLEITKASTNVWWHQSRESMTSGVTSLVQAIGSEDMVEGARAFLEKRRPEFRARRNESDS